VKQTQVRLCAAGVSITLRVDGAAWQPPEDGRMRYIGALTALLMLAVLAGCGRPASAPFCLANAAQLSSALLFDRVQGAPGATEMASRTDWPAVWSANRLGETITFRERNVDWQGPGIHGRDFSYRRFVTTRTGREVR
jgi:hypothetical protein